MWIKELPQNYYEQTSFCYGSVMLWQNDKVYVMDNHLSATWCWLQSCNPKKKYNFMHIDKHYDMLDCFYNEDLQTLKNNPRMAYDEYKNLKRTKDDFELFRWDNYIMIGYNLYPNWFNTNIFMTHKDGDIHGSGRHKYFIPYEENPLFMDSVINQYIGEPDKYLCAFKEDDYQLPWIVNLDLDVFYSDNPHIQLFSDEYIRHVAKVLNDNLTNIQVLTIALSPDCIGGDGMKEKWENSFHILKIMSEEIKCLRDFPFPC